MSETYWKVEDMAIGDFIEIEVVNKKGDRNLDGMILRGTIVELTPSHNQVKLDSGWCCQTKDKLLKHFICRAQMKNLDEDKLLRLFDLFFPKCGLLRDKENQCDWIANEVYEQIKEKIQKKFVKLHDANISWIYDIIQIVLENVSCDHQVDSDGAGKTYDDVSYSLDDEEDVLKKCVEAIPEVELKLEVDKEFIEEKAKLIVENLYMYKMDKESHYVPSASEQKHWNIKMKVARNFLLLIVKELQEKIK